MINTKNKQLLLLAFLILLPVVYFVMNIYKTARIDEILNEEAKYLEISYKQGLDRFSVIGNNIYRSMQDDKKFVNILSNVDRNNLKPSHDKLYKHLKDEFERLKMSGVLGLQIILPNNNSLVRMHKENKYGDDLSDIRHTVKYVNKEKVHIAAFEEGKTSHAFRELYPIYNDGKYIGLIDILFSSTKLQDYTMRASNIHTHFIVDKNVFKTNAWRSKVKEPYKESIEHKDFLFSMNDHIHHDRLEAGRRYIIEPLKDKIIDGISKREAFNLHIKTDKTVKVLVFLPVKRFVDNKTVAYLVSYTMSDKLYGTISNINGVIVAIFILLILIYVIFCKLFTDKEKIADELKYDALTNVYTRKYLMELSQKECEKLKASDEELSLVMADIDYFKKVNDTHGHQYGDIVLQNFAKILQSSLRSVDVVARYGGEEFIILLNTDKEKAKHIVENILKKIRVYEFGDKKIKLTASFGISECKEEDSVEDTVKRADVALYKAKESGRDQIQVI